MHFAYIVCFCIFVCNVCVCMCVFLCVWDHINYMGTFLITSYISIEFNKIYINNRAGYEERASKYCEGFVLSLPNSQLYLEFYIIVFLDRKASKI